MEIYAVVDEENRIVDTYTDKSSALNRIEMENKAVETEDGNDSVYTLSTYYAHVGPVQHDIIYGIQVTAMTKSMTDLYKIFGTEVPEEKYFLLPTRATVHFLHNAVRFGSDIRKPTPEEPYYSVNVSGFDLKTVQEKAQSIADSLNKTGELPKGVI